MSDTATKPGYVHGTYTPNEELWGLIPEFLNADDPRPAREQIDEAYIGGWRPLPGMRIEKIDEYNVIFRYSGDPAASSIILSMSQTGA